MKVNPTIFREYDVRGVAGTKFSDESLKEYEKWYGKFAGITITPDVGIAIGKAYGTLIHKRNGNKIVIGHEIRPFGEELKNYFIEGVLSTGIDVVDIGPSLTPIVYFSIAYYNYDGGVSVTGSHNIYFFNGFKMMAKNVYPICSDELRSMYQIITNEAYIIKGKGKYEEKSVKEDYKNYLLKYNKLGRKLKVVSDCGNGSAGAFAPKIVKEMGCDLIELFSTPDTSFPNHIPDPEDPDHLKDLMEKVISEKADLGIAFDADGDRFGVIDEKGNYVLADRILLLLAKDILKRYPGKKILYEVKCSSLFEELIPKWGGVPVIHPTGHALIKRTIREDKDVMLAGEVSGHFYFIENYFGIDDGVFSAVKFLSLLSNQNSNVSELIDEFPKTIMTPEIKLPCLDEIKHKVVEDIASVFSKKYKTITVDGVRIVFSNRSWGLVRASNTSPYLTIRVEANTEEEVIKIKNILADELEKYHEIGDKLDKNNVTSRTGRLGWL